LVHKIQKIKVTKHALEFSNSLTRTEFVMNIDLPKVLY